MPAGQDTSSCTPVDANTACWRSLLYVPVLCPEFFHACTVQSHRWEVDFVRDHRQCRSSLCVAQRNYAALIVNIIKQTNSKAIITTDA